MTDYPLVTIQWFDAACPDTLTQSCVDEALCGEPLVQEDCGFLLGKNAAGNAYVLAANISQGDQVRRTMLIPMVNVIRVTKFKETKGRVSV